MESYTSLSKLYDIFMDNVPYEEWGTFLQQLFKEYRIDDGLILELGCGTGNMTEILARKGYDMIGLDYSEEMLTEAAGKNISAELNILYLWQDMREFELNGMVNAVVSVCDSLNYITEPEELSDVFTLVYRNLEDDGVFIFDFNTEYKYREILGAQTIAENRDEGSFIWENYYDEASRINEYELTLFIRTDQEYYRRHQEMHYQRAYTLNEVKSLMESTGLCIYQSFDQYTKAPAHEKSERICVVAGKVK